MGPLDVEPLDPICTPDRAGLGHQCCGVRTCHQRDSIIITSDELRNSTKDYLLTFLKSNIHLHLVD